MRHESAMKVIRCLRGSLGEPLSILAICSRIDLSYQPTYRHVRELQASGVLSARRAGREVLCQLASSEAAALWLALASLEEVESFSTNGGDRLCRGLLSAARAGRLGEIAALAVLPTGGVEQVLALIPESGDAEVVRARVRAICHAQGAFDAEPHALSRAEFARRLRQEWAPALFAEGARVIVGHQALWEAVLNAVPTVAPAAEEERKPSPDRSSAPTLPPVSGLTTTDAVEEPYEEEFID